MSRNSELPQVVDQPMYGSRAYAESADGLAWSAVEGGGYVPCMLPAWAETAVDGISVVKIGEGLRLDFVGGPHGSVQRSALGTTEITRQRVPSKPPILGRLASTSMP